VDGILKRILQHRVTHAQFVQPVGTNHKQGDVIVLRVKRVYFTMEQQDLQLIRVNLVRWAHLRRSLRVQAGVLIAKQVFTRKTLVLLRLKLVKVVQ